MRLTTDMPASATKNFATRTRRIVVGASPMIQNPCPSRLSCGKTKREPNEHRTDDTLKMLRKAIRFRHSGGIM